MADRSTDTGGEARRLGLDDIARMILLADLEALLVLVGLSWPEHIDRLDTQSDDDQTKRLPDIVLGLVYARDAIWAIIEAQSEKDREMPQRMLDNVGILQRRLNRTPELVRPVPRVLAFEIRLRARARETLQVAASDDPMNGAVAWRVVNALTRPQEFPERLRAPEHAAVRALVRGVTLDDLRNLVAEASSLPNWRKQVQLLLLGLAGRVIFDEEVIEMSIPQQKEAVAALEERGRGSGKLLEHYEREWEREVEERVRRGEERGEERGEKRGERNAWLRMAEQLVDEEQFAHLQTLELEALRERVLNLQRALIDTTRR